MSNSLSSAATADVAVAADVPDVAAAGRARHHFALAARAFATRVLVVVAAALAGGAASAATVEVSFSSLPSDRGHALFALFDHAEGFPDRADVAAARLGGTVAAGRASVVFENVAPGRYAISALHDENDSGAIDLNLFGIPKEKFGVSNVAKGRPAWNDAQFDVSADGDTVVIELRPLRFF